MKSKDDSIKNSFNVGDTVIGSDGYKFKILKIDDKSVLLRLLKTGEEKEVPIKFFQMSVFFDHTSKITKGVN